MLRHISGFYTNKACCVLHLLDAAQQALLAKYFSYSCQLCFLRVVGLAILAVDSIYLPVLLGKRSVDSEE